MMAPTWGRPELVGEAPPFICTTVVPRTSRGCRCCTTLASVVPHAVPITMSSPTASLIRLPAVRATLSSRVTSEAPSRTPTMCARTPKVRARASPSGERGPEGRARVICTTPESLASLRRRDTVERDTWSWRAIDSMVSPCT